MKHNIKRKRKWLADLFSKLISEELTEDISRVKCDLDELLGREEA